MADDPMFQRFGREFPRGAVLFHEGERGQEMFVVHQGKVTISKRVGEVEKILSTLGPGEFLGEMAILNNRPRSATATCAEDSKVLVIDAKTFETMVRSSAEIAVRLIKKLSDRLAEANEQIENLLLTDAASRVVHWLAMSAERGLRTPAGQKIEVPPRELAARVGVRPEQADEALLKLLKAKLIAVHPDGFVVADVAKLRHFLEFLQMKAQFGDVA
ncbi:MAG: Crp/Fnr family transcriptional regulator [Anaeromyxobacter sp.]|nr:Crp/Fnr family transcriptional regulator [Anaeromyxobacter sp.]MBL0276067.1 Crp/Fnr family transcriptional regulator [Anaeromyxobacter sp.]